MSAAGNLLAAPLFHAGPYACFEMQRSEVPALQAFLEANPEYYLNVGDAPPSPSEARDEFENLPPAEWSMGKMWVLRFCDAQGRMAGLANVVSDLIATGVWHVGLFLVATSLHGTGAAPAMYVALEAWMRRSGARWLRLGVVVGNVRGERFWARCGFGEVRQRAGVAMGRRVNAVRVLVKPLVAAPLSDYLAVIARDHPDAP